VKKRRNTLIHIKLYQSRESVCILQTEKQEKDRVTEDSVRTCLQVGSSPNTVNRTVRMKLSTQDCRSDSSRSFREADGHNKMATEGHRKKRKAEKLAEEA
jgi:hypothetical protein